MEENKQETPALGKFGLRQVDDLTNEHELESSMFVEKEQAKGATKTVYDYFWFDVPLIFYDCEEGYDLMFALA